MSSDSPVSSEERPSSDSSFSRPMTLRWQTPAGHCLHTRCITRDISNKSIYCYIEHPLTVGLAVEFSLVFPVELTGTQPLEYHCTGTVLRVERFMVRNGCGVSIAINNRVLLEAPTNLNGPTRGMADQRRFR